MELKDKISLDDKYTLEKGRIYITGTQALVRLPMIQRQKDKLNNLNTAVFISGYRGSPLGMYDKTLWSAKKFLKNNNIDFVSGLNEDLAATAVWGSQQPGLISKSTKDGILVYGMEKDLVLTDLVTLLNMQTQLELLLMGEY